MGEFAEVKPAPIQGPGLRESFMVLSPDGRCLAESERRENAEFFKDNINAAFRAEVEKAVEERDKRITKLEAENAARDYVDSLLLNLLKEKGVEVEAINQGINKLAEERDAALRRVSELEGANTIQHDEWFKALHELAEAKNQRDEMAAVAEEKDRALHAWVTYDDHSCDECGEGPCPIMFNLLEKARNLWKRVCSLSAPSALEALKEREWNTLRNDVEKICDDRIASLEKFKDPTGWREGAISTLEELKSSIRAISRPKDEKQSPVSPAQGEE